MAVEFPILSTGQGSTPRISSLLIKPASAVCNLDCSYCFYLDREADPYSALPARRMTDETLERLVDTFLFYSYPNSAFAFQGGEPTLAGPAFFENLVKLQERLGRSGQAVANSMQTNGILLNERWCQLFRQYNWLVGISIDGPEPMHDLFRLNKQGAGTWRKVMAGLECLQKHGVDFNVLCVVSRANAGNAAGVYKFFRAQGIAHIQYIPLSEFDSEDRPLPFTIAPEEYGRFLCETFELWWPERRKVRIRYFDNIAEALAGQKPSTCTMLDACDSYAVVEFNGDVYPCDFFVEKEWKLGNIHIDSWAEIARRQRRYQFAAKKAIGHPECQVCDYQTICRGGCPKHRHDPRRDFSDLDYFCPAYKMIFAKTIEPLRKEVNRITSPSRLGQSVPYPIRPG